MFLLSAGFDVDNSITVHDWIAKRLIGTSKTGRGKINGLAWKNDTEFVFNIHNILIKDNSRNSSC